MQQPNAHVIVIGAGAAGITAVSQILDKTDYSIIWIDPFFLGGEMEKYKQIPSNAMINYYI